MKYKISLAYNLAIIIGSLIILCILISRGYDIYVILIPILTILASLINLICDIKKHKWLYINATLYSYKVVFFSQTIAYWQRTIKSNQHTIANIYGYFVILYKQT